MAPTIRDVAKRAGVSHTTVSNVLNNVPKVSEETRQRVLKAMEELGFEPNFVARSLYTKRSFVVGYMVPAITNEFFMSVARGPNACSTVKASAFSSATRRSKPAARRIISGG